MLQLRGIHTAGGNRVDAYPRRAEFECQCLGQGVKRAFGGGINAGGPAGQHSVCEVGRDIEDVAACCGKLVQQRLAEEIRRFDVEVEMRVEQGLIGIGKGNETPQPGIVDKDIHLRQGCCNTSGQCGDGGRIGQIGGNGASDTRVCFQAVLCFGQFGRVSGDKDKPGSTRLCKCAGDAQSDAVAAAGDNSVFAGEELHNLLRVMKGTAMIVCLLYG